VSEQLTPDLLTGLRNGAWLDEQVFPPLTYAVPGIIPEGFTLLVGPPKIGKSWFVLACALAVADGGRALGSLSVVRCPVLYLALEDGNRRLQDRCRILLGDDPIPAGFEYLTTVMPSLIVPTIEQWLQRHDGAGPLVILDTLGKVMPPALSGESAYQRDYRIGSTLKRSADEHPGTSVLVNHHDRKATADDFVDSVSGTHGLAGAADTVITLTRARHETSGTLKVVGRDVAEGEYALTFKSGAKWNLVGTGLAEASQQAAKIRAAAGLGDRSAEIVAYVAQHPAGVRAAEVSEALGLDARRYMARLVDSGRLRRPSRGLYTPVPSVPLSQTEGSPMGQRDTWDTPTGGLTLVAPPCPECGHPLDSDEHGRTCEGDAA
jgi:AAA domain/Transcriptional regulator, AbiEi antitoxin